MITLRRARVWEGWHYLCSIPADGWRAALCCPSSQSHGWGYALDECDGGCWCYCYYYHDEKYWWQRPSKWNKQKKTWQQGTERLRGGKPATGFGLSHFPSLLFESQMRLGNRQPWRYCVLNSLEKMVKSCHVKGREGRKLSFGNENYKVDLWMTKKGWTKVLFKCHLYFGQCQVTSGKEDMSGSRVNM